MNETTSKTPPAICLLLLFVWLALAGGCQTADSECAGDGDCGSDEFCAVSGGVFFAAGTCLPTQGSAARAGADAGDAPEDAAVTGDATADAAGPSDVTGDATANAEVGGPEADASPDVGADTGSGPAFGEFGGPCSESVDCKTGRCQRFGRRRLCTVDCGSEMDCRPDGLVCSRGACTPEDYCDYSRGKNYGEGPGCRRDVSCGNCAEEASCVSRSTAGRTDDFCLCDRGWVGDGATCRKDSDGDRLADADETSAGQTSASNPDSDRDGLEDGAETLVWGTNPMLLDSDGDYLPDGPEVTRHFTDPAAPDTDGDGWDDGTEALLLKTDPTIASDVGGAPRPLPKGSGPAVTWVDSKLYSPSNLSKAEATLHEAEPRALQHFIHAAPVDFYSTQSTWGAFRNQQTHFFNGTSSVWEMQTEAFAGVFSGLIYVPAGQTTTTYAIASEEGHRFELFTGNRLEETVRSETAGSPVANSALELSPLLSADFRRAGSLYAFELLAWDSEDSAGLEWSRSGGETSAFSPNTFQPVAPETVAAPRLKIDSRLSRSNTDGDGTSATLSAVISNDGAAYAWGLLLVPTVPDYKIRSVTWKTRPRGARPQTVSYFGAGRQALLLPFLGPGQTVTAEFTLEIQDKRLRPQRIYTHVLGASYPLDEINTRRLRNVDITPLSQ